MADTDPIRTACRQPVSITAYVACYLLLGTLVALAWAGHWNSVPINTAAVLSQPPADPQAQGGSTSPASAPEIEFKVDPNSAGWAELAGLPGIGEVLAKRIVEYRQQQTATGGGRSIVFRRPEDLEGVRGIGPKTVEKLAKHLRFPEPATRPGP